MGKRIHIYIGIHTYIYNINNQEALKKYWYLSGLEEPTLGRVTKWEGGMSWSGSGIGSTRLQR